MRRVIALTPILAQSLTAIPRPSVIYAGGDGHGQHPVHVRIWVNLYNCISRPSVIYAGGDVFNCVLLHLLHIHSILFHGVFVYRRTGSTGVKVKARVKVILGLAAGLAVVLLCRRPGSARIRVGARASR